ncbi:hypothetical protein [Flavihumibacter fluvii]|uniref:hypothetical protein n=1 Tax=Flavihumibacter fluvii TaxID=2838157 RepID=UPI001BDF15BD|nr:hypothetical protein [Flavihumibacter fluvii]ULQ54296.1 hypothetical protein KJS93_08195 [Flavihumibacter fluvii]
MNKAEKLILIKGTFNDEDAKEILMNIFSAKIHFHELKNFSSQERFGKEDETAKKRIPDLKRSIDKIEDKIAEARAKNKKLVITSEINISLSDD